LADKISKAWANLPEEDQEELQRLNSKQKDERSEAKETALLERLRAFGRWPQEYASSKSRVAETERKLAHDIRKRLETGFLSKAAEAEIDEMHWMRKRELEANALEDKAATQEARRQATRTRQQRLRTLFALLRTSTLRCDCHDFAHWYALWRCDPQLATRLRLAGHHFRHCRLVRAAAQPPFGESIDNVDASADSDDDGPAVKLFWPLSLVRTPTDEPDPGLMQRDSLARERARGVQRKCWCRI
jgi:hypothetical protein